MKTQINRKQPEAKDKYTPEPGDFFIWSEEPNKVCLATKEGLPYYGAIPHLDLGSESICHMGADAEGHYVKLIPTGSGLNELTFELASEYRG